MRRHGQYPSAVVSPMGSSQTQNVSSQRMQQDVATKKYIGQQDIVSTKDDHKSMPLKAEERWQWDRDATRGSNMMPSHQFKEGKYLFFFMYGDVALAFGHCGFFMVY